MREERKPLSRGKRLLLGYFAALILLLTAIGIMTRLGYLLIRANVEYLLFGLFLCSALVAGLVWLCNRIRLKWLRIVAGGVGALLVLLLAMAVLMVYMMQMLFTRPTYYTTLTSGGKTDAVVLRRISDDETLAAERAEALGETELTGEHYGFLYEVHPRALHFFYNAKIVSDGRLEIGSESQAQLMYEWLDDETLHMYIDNPEPGDGGELTYRAG